jgi:hypothetical protein
LCFAIRHLANPSRLISEESDWNDLLDLHEKVIINLIKYFSELNEIGILHEGWRKRNREIEK